VVKQPVTEVKPLVSPCSTGQSDIAHARLEFRGGALPTDGEPRIDGARTQVRFLSAAEYISARLRAPTPFASPSESRPAAGISPSRAPAATVEPLRAELESFVERSNAYRAARSTEQQAERR